MSAEDIKLKLKEYIMELWSQGATKISIQKAVKELALTVSQVIYAYEELIREKWLKAPSGFAPIYDERGMPRKETTKQ